MTVEYPAADYNQGNEILTQLGLFWSAYFESERTLSTMFRGHGQLEWQSYLDYLAAVASLARVEIPLFSRDIWYHLTLKESELNSIKAMYGDPGIFYGDTTLKYGGPGGEILYEFPIPDELTEAPNLIVDSIANPVVMLTQGIEYEIDDDRNAVRFGANPFDNDKFTVKTIYDPDLNQITDREISLWLFNSDWDFDALYRHFGYAIGVVVRSGEFDKNLLNAYWDMFLLGATTENLLRYLAAVAGIPIVKSDETVETIIYESDGVKIVTDKEVYIFPVGSIPLVIAGDTVKYGDILVDTVRLITIDADGSNLDDIQALAMGKNLLAGDHINELTFYNKMVELVYLGVNEHNQAVVEFEISGTSEDIETFWNSVETRSAALGVSLAKALATVPDATMPVDPAYLPAQVNPLKLIMTEVFRNNLFIIKLRTELFSDQSAGLYQLSALRKVVLPNTTYIIFAQVDIPVEVMDVSGLEESVDDYRAPGIVSETVYEHSGALPGDPAYRDVAVIVRPVAPLGGV